MQNEPKPNKPAPPRKQMHGCLTVWLWLVIIMNIVGVALTVFAPGIADVPELPGWYLPVAITSTVFVVIFAAALLKWKAWGFWGLVALEGISVLVNIAESNNYFYIASGALAVAILVILLNMGGENKAWNHLE